VEVRGKRAAKVTEDKARAKRAEHDRQEVEASKVQAAIRGKNGRQKAAKKRQQVFGTASSLVLELRTQKGRHCHETPATSLEISFFYMMATARKST
jgi:hypothetical protein